jgi:predicted Zn-dependent peptidase
MEQVQMTTLPNGVRILTEKVSSVQSVSLGLWCQTGSAAERSDEAGITHLIEHMLFKGTPERTALQIAQEVEGRGGHLNAFTDKQATCYYAKVLSEDMAPAADVLGDMLSSSLIDADELVKERQVVIEEIKRSEDEPGDQVHDLHLQSRWPGHPLGLPIIGTRESVGGFERENLVNYMDRRYRGGRLLAAASGMVEHEEFVEAVQKRLGGIAAGSGDESYDRPVGSDTEHHESKDVEQVHFCIGSDAPAIGDDDATVCAVMNDLFGGGMMSRLFQEIREKRGLVYSVGSYRLPYSHGGALTVYGGCSPEHFAEVRRVVRAEMDKLMAEPPAEEEIERSRKSVLGSLIMSQESMSSRMMRMARNELTRGRQIPLDEIREQVLAVDGAAIQKLAARLFQVEKVSTTYIGRPA